MKQFPTITLALLAFAGMLSASTLPFETVTGFQNITNDSVNPSLRVVPVGDALIRFVADEGAFPLCAVDGTLGLQFPAGGAGCAGGEVSSAGIYGTTEGTLNITFQNGMAWNDLFIPFQIFATSGRTDPGTGDPLTDPFSVSAILSYQGSPTDFLYWESAVLPDAVNPSIVSGVLGANAVNLTSPFDMIDLRFTPLGPQGTELFGTTTFEINSIATPEPASIALIGLGLAGLGLLGRKRLRS